MKLLISLIVASISYFFVAYDDMPQKPQLIPYYASSATVGVSGYGRSDGTYVYPHYRRRPGVAQRDLNTNQSIHLENYRRIKYYENKVKAAKLSGRQTFWGMLPLTYIITLLFEKIFKLQRSNS